MFDINKKDMLNRAEIYYTGKENIEGYAVLVNFFMRSLANSSTHPSLINVDNNEPFDENNMKEG